MRELANMPGDDPKWLMLDGDLDANWIESMNSVMDDNRLLTLPSNERIRVLPHMKLIFEIRDLKFATPATATRAGILYISEGQQWHNMAMSWINRWACGVLGWYVYELLHWYLVVMPSARASSGTTWPCRVVPLCRWAQGALALSLHAALVGLS